MSVVETIQDIVIKQGHNCSVERTQEGRVVCNIDGSAYSPFDAADKFILGGWGTVWNDRT